MESKEHTLSILVENTPGVLSQVSRLFSRKGYNIESIASGTTEDPKVTRITIVMNGDDATIAQLAAQLRKLLCVISVKVLSTEDAVQRELVLVKVKADTKDKRDEVLQIVSVFRASVVDISRETLTVSILGDENKACALMDLLADFGVLEVVRTGIIAIERGIRTIYEDTKESGEFNYGKNVL
ncbi:acetolactate synthase small subunit [uncultured Intestinimonas sp.]|uniref:acetolactate synthase small subunit n=1 Tax=Intestinimonas sp. HCP28S3_D6 TaxID=3438942 RepID=UPI0025E61330|nr:acetolactate synthase small subunit [uncultured Intestinimonas sp.]